jgi:hypothetical protein
MKINLSKVRRRPDWPAWAVIVVAAWLCLVAVDLVIAQYTHVHAHLCLFRNITGLPCPTCGCTRGAMSLLRGDLRHAFAFNPLMFVVAVAAAGHLAMRLLAGKAIRWELSPRERRIAWIASIAAVAGNWAYLLIVDR